MVHTLRVKLKHTYAAQRIIEYLEKDLNEKDKGLPHPLNSKEISPLRCSLCPLALALKEQKGWIKILSANRNSSHYRFRYTFIGLLVVALEMITRTQFITVKSMEGKGKVGNNNPYYVTSRGLPTSIFGKKRVYRTDELTTQMIQWFDNGHYLSAMTYDATITRVA